MGSIKEPVKIISETIKASNETAEITSRLMGM
jgi:hypothetical protein